MTARDRGTATAKLTRLRWHGDPLEPEQPDIGDVLFEDHGERIYSVRLARELTRGPHAGKPHELALTVEKTHIGAVQTARTAGARVYPCTRDRR